MSTRPLKGPAHNDNKLLGILLTGPVCNLMFDDVCGY